MASPEIIEKESFEQLPQTHKQRQNLKKNHHGFKQV
jgi:hypothetical protein